MTRLISYRKQINADDVKNSIEGIPLLKIKQIGQFVEDITGQSDRSWDLTGVMMVKS